MRLNAHEYAAMDFKTRSLMARCWIYLNNERVMDCVIADEEAGYIVQYARDPRGNILVDEHGEAQTRRLEGDVRILDPQKDAN